VWNDDEKQHQKIQISRTTSTANLAN